MKKIRINELARVLEIKANLILDKLPDFGVTEKKTHSSSVDEDVAEKLRVYFENGGGDRGDEGEAASRPSSNGHGVSAPEAAPESIDRRPDPREAREDRAEPAPAEAREPAETDSGHAAPEPVITPPLAPVPPGVEAPTAESEKPSPRMAPLRPPLAPQGKQPPSAPPIAAPAGPGRPIPPAVRPMPMAPRPGQVLSGPRQPFPGGMPQPRPAAPARPAGPSAPKLATQTYTPAPGGAPGGASGGPPPGQRPLVGQPALRPVVPPRPDLARKLQQPMRPLGSNPAFAAPAASPKPGVPLRQQAPAPGRPIYQGPIRPGQPMVQRGAPSPGMRT
ncbi:MAG: translation initiation factor IF-2 N-terminal domain-containing protein, partial [Acidobacteriota bacterium]|nr:translation initiation factor IF-2 N-terminal domain-containing protein [Acidobacteriota bacterium]